MNLAKPARVQLDREAYDKLRRSVLERDGWRCQFCGATSGLEVHHIHYRSRLGADTEQNLITLCWSCHKSVHEAASCCNKAR